VCGNHSRRQDQLRLSRAAQFEECPMTPVRIEAEADVLGALGFEKMEASQ